MVEIIDKYDHIGEFYQGVAIVVKDNLYGEINSSGEKSIEPKYQYLKEAKDGIYIASYSKRRM